MEQTHFKPNNMKTQDIETQKGKLLGHLYGTMNEIDALECFFIAGTMKASTRLAEIAKEHNLLLVKRKQEGTKYLKYSLVEPNKQLSL